MMIEKMKIAVTKIKVIINNLITQKIQTKFKFIKIIIIKNLLIYIKDLKIKNL